MLAWKNQSCMEPDWFASEPAGYELRPTWAEDEWVVMKEGWEDQEEIDEFEVGRAALLEDAMRIAETHRTDNH